MERPAYSLKVIAGISVLVILHAVGLAGFALSSFSGMFQDLVPVHLLISATLLLIFHQRWSWRFGVSALSVAIGGWLVEYIGVQATVPFGAYYYTSALGPAVGGIPLLMALNWLMLIYGVGGIVQRIPVLPIGRIVIGGLLMVLLDVALEKFAIAHNLWVWEADTVPLKNYGAWFVISGLFLWLLLANSRPADNPLAFPLILIQGVFFYTGYLSGIW